jgi:putative peptidoglycan lipid II flippase
LIFYCIGLFAYSSVRLTASTFYSMGDTKTPVKTSVVAVAVNILLNLLLMYPLGFKGLALAASIAAMTNLFLLLWILDKRVGPLARRDIALTFLKILSGASLMGVIIWIYLKYLTVGLQTAALHYKIIQLLAILILGLLSFFILSYILGLKEQKRVLELVKLKRCKSAGDDK